MPTEFTIFMYSFSLHASLVWFSVVRSGGGISLEVVLYKFTITI